MSREKFKKAIEKYIKAETPTARSAVKGAITRIVNSWTDWNALEQVKEVMAEFDELPELIKNRFTPGSLYRERDLVFGWYREGQIQAESIPVDVPLVCKGYMKVLATRDGFVKAVPLPLSGGNTVCVPHEQTFLYAKYGYANPCPLQWYRDEEGYKVDRSIIPHGFWQAWKWWNGACYWYLEHRPELFEDFDCWGQTERGGQPEPSSAVLGGRNKEFWESQKFYLE